MKQETIKIQVLNDTKLSIRPVLPDGKTVVPVEDITNLRVSWGVNGHEVESMIEPEIIKKDGYLVLPISSMLPLGVYDVHIQGTIGGREISDNRLAMFELVKYGNGISYDNYYTDMVIIGLPDSELERLKAEYEAKRDEYQHLVDELNRGEVATKADLGLAPGETVAGLIKAGGGGGGGLTPEQWAQIAKEETLTGLASTLAAYQTANAAKLDTIITNTSLTAAQADEDWQNVKPV